ncbi:PorP/SprF family type IX secretion system membrane protein [Flavobacterium sp.]
MKLNIQIKNAYCLLLISLFTDMVNAQQDPQYTQYMYNTMTVNSAYAGSTGTLEAVLLHRSQWVGIEGAPETQAFTVHAPLSNERIGLGVSAVNDKLGPSNELYLDGNFSYTIPLGYEHKLAFGLKAGMRMLNVDWSKGRYRNPVDPILNENIDNQMKPSLGAGIYLHTDKWYVGFSVPNFIRNNYYDDIQEAVNRDRFHYFLIGGYVFDISDNLKFKPAFMVKAVSGAPLAYDLSANFLIHEKFTAGASYRYDDSVSALAGFQVTNSFFIGYAFDYTTSELNKYNDGSHEIILRFQMQKKSSQMKSPRFF